MKFPRIVRLSLLTASSLVFFSSVAHAQDSDDARVVRLSRTDGQVLVSHTGSDSWEDAPAKLPLQEGILLRRRAGSRKLSSKTAPQHIWQKIPSSNFTQLTFSGGGRITSSI